MKKTGLIGEKLAMTARMRFLYEAAIDNGERAVEAALAGNRIDADYLAEQAAHNFREFKRVEADFIGEEVAPEYMTLEDFNECEANLGRYVTPEMALAEARELTEEQEKFAGLANGATFLLIDYFPNMNGVGNPIVSRGVAAPDKLPKYYECGICDCYHPADWDGDFRNDANRFALGELDEKHGAQGWQEVPMPDSPRFDSIPCRYCDEITDHESFNCPNKHIYQV